MTAHKHAALFRAIADGDDLRHWEGLFENRNDFEDVEEGRLASIAIYPEMWNVRRKPGSVKTETRTYECLAHVNGSLHWFEQGKTQELQEQWRRVPSLDKTVEVVL